MSTKKKVLIAFSGGLDTSYCVKYLDEICGFEVHTAVVNTGGFSPEDLVGIEERASSLGSKSHQVLEVTQRFYDECLRFLIYGNVLRNHTYPLSVSAERCFQALALVQYAKELDVEAIAHGSTGAGNDQIRFDLTFQVFAPDLEIITPIRDQQLSREDEIKFLAEHGLALAWEKAKYSINKGIWGTSVGGAETLTSDQALPNDAFPSQLTAEGTKDITLHFNRGELVAIDEEIMTAVQAIQRLEEIASAYAIGRDMHVGDTIIGIKGRVGFEAAAPLVLLKAHQTLEKHTLTKWQQHWKDQLGSFYGMMVHEAQFLDPSLRNIEAFLKDSQKHVSGDVHVTLSPYQFHIKGITSDNDLMNSSFGAYGEMNSAWSGEDAKGFTKILSNSLKLYYAAHPKELTKVSDDKA